MSYDIQEVKLDNLMVHSGLKLYESQKKNTEQIQQMANKLQIFFKNVCSFEQNWILLSNLSPLNFTNGMQFFWCAIWKRIKFSFKVLV